MKWMGPAAIFVAFQLCVAGALALHVGYSEPPPLGKYGRAAALPVLFYCAGLALWRLRTLPENPIAYLREQDWSECFRFAGAMCLVWLQFTALTWTKAMIPFVTTMWADVPLAGLDVMFFGRDAYLYFPEAGPFMDYAYGLWFVILCLSFVGVYFRLSERRDALLLGFFLTVGLLGVFGQYALPSGGPIFYERLGFGDRFAAMLIPELAWKTSNYLWLAYSGGNVDIAIGISAFPSIHVATAMWIAIAFRHWLAYSFLALIFVGSIMLGWHYALDGIAGAVGAWLCYYLARVTLQALTLAPARNDQVRAKP